MKRISILITFVMLTLMALAGGFSLMVLTAGTAYADTPVNETRPAAANGEIRISNLAGSVKVQGWDKNQVQVTGSIGDDVDHLEVEADSGNVYIRVILPHHSHSDDCGECADLVVNVPRNGRIEVNTVSADVGVKDVSGAQQLETVSGEIVLASTSADITAKTVSGDVRVNGSAPKARVAASGVSGNVDVAGIDGELDAESVSGDVHVGSGHVTRAQLSSTSGTVEYGAGFEKGGSYDFHNVSGDIKITLSGNPSARYDVSTFSGDIDNNFGPKPVRVSKYSPGMELRFTNGSGDADVSIKTLSGDVTLRD